MSMLKNLSQNKALIAVIMAVAALVYLNATGVLTSQKMMVEIKANKDWMSNNLMQGVLFVVVVDFLFIICFFPGSWFLELFSGYVFGLSVGVGTILMAKFMAACACFFLGQTLLSGWVRRLLAAYPAFHRFYEASGSSGWQLVLAARLSPLPSYVCSYGFSLTAVSFRDFAAATLFASVPMVVQNVYMGTLVSSIDDLTSGGGGGGSASQWLQMALPFVGTMAIVVWTQRFMARLSATDGPVSPVASRLRSRDTPSRARSPAPPKQEGCWAVESFVTVLAGVSEGRARTPRRRTPSKPRARSPAGPRSPRTPRRARTPSKGGDE